VWQCRGVVERGRIPCEQQVYARIQQIARVAWRGNEAKDWTCLACDRDFRVRRSSGRIGRDSRPVGSRAQGPERSGEGSGDGQVGMSERDRRIRMLTAGGDGQDAVVDGCDRLDEATDGRKQVDVAVAAAAPARAHVGRRDWRPVREPGVLAQREQPRASVGVEAPGRGQAGFHATMAVDPDQRLVHLAEQQALAFVGRAGRVRGFDSVPERYGLNRLARLGEYGAVALVSVDRRKHWWRRCSRRWSRSWRRR
jgi:hypothetical protein